MTECGVDYIREKIRESFLKKHQEVTPEEAIRRINYYLYNHDELRDERTKRAFEMAIKALEAEPCEQPDKAVSLNSVIKLTCEECPEDYKEEWCKGVDCVFIDMLKELPPVTPAVKTGKWIQKGGKLPYCSECGAYSDDADRGIYFKDKGESVNEEARFCPNCGSYNGGKE